MTAPSMGPSHLSSEAWESTLHLRVKAGVGPEAQCHPNRLEQTHQQSKYAYQSLSTFSLPLKHFPLNPRATTASLP